MKFIRATLAAVLAVCAAGSPADPLRDAILLKGREELKTIAEKAGIDHKEDAGLEELQKLVYEYAQSEKPAGVPRKYWDGTDMPEPKAQSTPPKAKAQAKAAAGAQLDGMADMLFKTLDKDQDGTLSREEMAPMIEKVNAAAKAAGEAVPADFFATLDTNQDGKVDRSEADATFKRLSGAAAGAGAKPAAATGSADEDMSAPLFKAMDKDHDGALSRAEMADLIEKGNAANKAQGIPDVDFFETLDWNKDGSISREESKEWFAAMAKELSSGKKDEL